MEEDKSNPREDSLMEEELLTREASDEVLMEEEEDEVDFLPMANMTIGLQEALIETRDADGEVVMAATASQFLDDMIRARTGHISTAQAIAEARSMREILLSKEGIPEDPDDPTSKMRFPDWTNEDDVRRVFEHKQVGVYARRDIADEPAPTDVSSTKETIGGYAPGDYILFDRSRDIHFPVRGDAPFPMDDTEVELTLRDKGHSVEQLLMNYPLINIPVYTPRLMCLLHEGTEWPVVMDSFTLFRYQIVMKRILASLWKFSYDSDMSYLDSTVESIVREAVATNEEWVPALPAPEIMAQLVHPPSSPVEEEEAMEEEEDSHTPKTGLLPSTVEEWWVCLPEWFRTATTNGLKVEEWANTLFRARVKGKGHNRRAVVPTEDQLEGIMAEWATLQDQMRTNYITLKLSDELDKQLRAHGFDPAHPEEAVGHVPFLKTMLVVIANATTEFLRSNETLMLRMMARHVPFNQWEWFMSPPIGNPMFDKMGRDITKSEAIKQQVYRDQVRKIRLKCLSGFDAPANQTESIVPGAPTYADMSCLWTWYNFEISDEDKFNRLQELIMTIMPEIEHMKKRVEYTPDPEAMAPLIAKLDAQGIPNSMRDSFLRGDPDGASMPGSGAEKRGGDESGGEEEERKREKMT